MLLAVGAAAGRETRAPGPLDRRLPVGAAQRGDQTPETQRECPSRDVPEQVGNLRYSRLGSLRYGAGATPALDMMPACLHPRAGREPRMEFSVTV